MVISRSPFKGITRKQINVRYKQALELGISLSHKPEDIAAQVFGGHIECLAVHRLAVIHGRLDALLILSQIYI